MAIMMDKGRGEERGGRRGEKGDGGGEGELKRVQGYEKRSEEKDVRGNKTRLDYRRGDEWTGEERGVEKSWRRGGSR